MPALHIRAMQRHEVDLALQWAHEEGWNPGLHDAEPFFSADPQGFLLGLLQDDPVCIVSAVRYGAAEGFLGFYIARPDARGQGHGLAIWQAAMEHLRGRRVGLDGVLAQQHNYRKSGFVLAHRNIRFEGVAGAAPTASTTPTLPTLPTSPPPGTTIVAASHLPPGQLAAYDRAFFPAARERFLALWISRPGTVALALQADDVLQGCGVIRPCRKGWKIGPLFADTPAGAEALYTALIARVPPGDPVFLDVPEPQREAMALAQRHRMTPMFETARMYNGAAPEISLPRTYGITSFELG